MEIILFIGIVGAILNALLASARGREPWLWGLIGFLFGIFSLLVLAVMPNLKNSADVRITDRSVEHYPPTPIPTVPDRGDAPRSEAALPPATKVCPDCAEEVRVEARICRFCRHEFAPQGF